MRSTLKGLLLQRETFFAERVDGLFRSLSKTHITNAPEGFGKRMILARAVNEWGGVDHSTAGVINDLRCIIARFMGRDEPKWDATSSVVRYART
ncbi:MAG: restriction endonuclease subunit M, partial [Planctomycetaceae bacterium]|nr:restriction endonuclease subunit M [Planctomycetaceae bacterium]